MWDEATYANNAIDMFISGNYMVVEQLGQVDFYNTKPPFVLWCQVLCMKLFGVNEFAVRLPSAIFGMLTILMVFFFCKLYLKSVFTGLISAIILLTTPGYISNHVVRTGDLDSILVFWLTGGLFIFIKLYIDKAANKNLNYLLLSICIIAGFLTKGIAGLFFVPAMFIISILFNRKIYREKALYISAVCIALICLGYYILREYYSPGFLSVIWNTEIMRYGKVVMSWQIQPINYYFQNLLNYRFVPFIYFLPLVFISYFITNSENRILISCLTISIVSYFLLISFPQVKLEWYDAPLFPILAILTGFSFLETGKYLINKILDRLSDLKQVVLIFIVAILLLIQPYNAILSSTAYPEKNIYELEAEGAYLKYISNSIPDIKNITVFKQEKNSELYDQVLFYKRAFEIKNIMSVKITSSADFKSNELVMTCKENEKSIIENLYQTKKLFVRDTGVIYRVISKR